MDCPIHNERLVPRVIDYAIKQDSGNYKMFGKDWEQFKNYKNDAILRLNPSAEHIFVCPKCSYAVRRR